MGKTIEIKTTNPWSGETVYRDITDITQDQMDAYMSCMDDATKYDLEGAGETPAETLSCFVDLVGPEEAGRVIIGA